MKPYLQALLLFVCALPIVATESRSVAAAESNAYFRPLDMPDGTVKYYAIDLTPRHGPGDRRGRG